MSYQWKYMYVTLDDPVQGDNYYENFNFTLLQLV